MSARRLCSLTYGALVEHLDEDGRAELDATLEDVSLPAQHRNAKAVEAILMAGGEIG